jgi:hypothetical protein
MQQQQQPVSLYMSNTVFKGDIFLDQLNNQQDDRD